MQYPIIDNLIDAYQRNGWTGLEVIEGKNLLNPNNYLVYTSAYYNFNIENGTLTTTGPILMGFIIPVQVGLNYVFSCSNVFPENVSSIVFRIREYSDLPEEWTTDFIAQPINTNVGINPEIQYITNDATVKYILCVFYTAYSGIEISNIQFEEGTEATPYEPYEPPTTDIKDRLKLPMIHYFPHPVIDALQRAAAGTQTADDTEILRHYLTPLGIGGI